MVSGSLQRVVYFITIKKIFFLSIWSGSCFSLSSVSRRLLARWRNDLRVGSPLVHIGSGCDLYCASFHVLIFDIFLPLWRSSGINTYYCIVTCYLITCPLILKGCIWWRKSYIQPFNTNLTIVLYTFWCSNIYLSKTIQWSVMHSFCQWSCAHNTFLKFIWK